MKKAGKILLCIVIVVVVLFCGIGVFMRPWISQTYKRLDEWRQLILQMWQTESMKE